MNPKQCDFRSVRSCLPMQLLEHHNKILEEMEKSNNIDFTDLDFEKAFDKIDHGIIGINGKVAVWIYNFLLNIQQCVSVNVTTSSKAHVIHKWSNPTGQC